MQDPNTLSGSREAKLAFLRLTGDTGNIDRLYGPSQAVNRATIVSILLGERVVKSNPRTSWHRFRQTMLDLFAVPSGSCIAVEDKALAGIVAGESLCLVCHHTLKDDGSGDPVCVHCEAGSVAYTVLLPG